MAKQIHLDIIKSLGCDHVIPISEFPNYFDWPSLSTLRNMRFKSKSPSSQKVDQEVNAMIYKKAGRIVINLITFLEWRDQEEAK